MAKCEDLWVLGSGESILRYAESVKKLNSKDTIVLQRCFPHIYTMYDIIPTYWTWADPTGAMEGFEFLNSMRDSDLKKFKDMTIILPEYVAAPYQDFRCYAGTTPMGRVQHGWGAYQYYLEDVQRRGIKVMILPATSTKRLQLFPDTELSLKGKDWLGGDFEERFKNEKVIIGSTPFDSESVIGDQYKWGLENKLSSFMLPIADKLGAKNVYILGFDCVGGRFYEVSGISAYSLYHREHIMNSGDRHPWNDESQKKSMTEIPLDIMRKWLEWKPSHKMNIYNVVEDEFTALNNVFEYKEFEQALGRV